MRVLEPGHSPHDLRRVVWACRLRAVLRCPGLALAAHRADAAICKDKCLVPRFGDWLRRTIIAEFRIAPRHAEWLPPRIREHANPQTLIMRMAADEAGAGEVKDMVARRMSRLLGEAVHPPQVEVVAIRLRAVFRASPFAVALASLKVVCSGMPTSRKSCLVSTTSRSGCRAIGVGDRRQYFFCPVVAELFHRHDDWRRPGSIAGGDMCSLLLCLLTEPHDTVSHAVWHHMVARGVACTTHRHGVASHGWFAYASRLRIPGSPHASSAVARSLHLGHCGSVLAVPLTRGRLRTALLVQDKCRFSAHLARHTSMDVIPIIVPRYLGFLAGRSKRGRFKPRHRGVRCHSRRGIRSDRV